METKILKYKEKEIKIFTKMNVLQFDKTMLLQKKYESGEIGDFEITFRTAGILLVDKEQEMLINEILLGEMGEDVYDMMGEWAETITPIIEGSIEAKKKQKISSGNIKKQKKVK